MFGTLIDVGNDGNVFLQDKALALAPKLWAVYKKKGMGSKMVRWIVMVDDYKSPYRKKPLDERVELVTNIVFGKPKYKTCGDGLVIAAREEYAKMQYDPLIDQYNAMSDQIYKMTKVYKTIIPTEENLEDINNIQIQMGKASKARDDIKTLIIKDQESEVKIQGAGTEDFSMFEEEQRYKGE
tara:strand:+ start:3989 stop:4534 length:546 start_codon:yes stop_codon:yes gene_type:complete